LFYSFGIGLGRINCRISADSVCRGIIDVFPYPMRLQERKINRSDGGSDGSDGLSGIGSNAGSYMDAFRQISFSLLKPELRRSSPETPMLSLPSVCGFNPKERERRLGSPLKFCIAAIRLIRLIRHPGF
jgi:hypothetical protein